jgi:hypothetical protein
MGELSLACWAIAAACFGARAALGSSAVRHTRTISVTDQIALLVIAAACAGRAQYTAQADAAHIGMLVMSSTMAVAGAVLLGGALAQMRRPWWLPAPSARRRSSR